MLCTYDDGWEVPNVTNIELNIWKIARGEKKIIKAIESNAVYDGWEVPIFTGHQCVAVLTRMYCSVKKKAFILDTVL